MIQPVNYKKLIEPVLLFSVLFLPGYISQYQPFDGKLLVDTLFNIVYIISVIPQVLLIVYLIVRDNSAGKEKYGLNKITWKEALYGSGVALVIFLCILPLITLSSFTGVGGNEVLTDIKWQAVQPEILPFVFITSIVTGYREELFFRSYLINKLTEASIEKRTAIGGSVLLFSAGHIYQGFFAFLSALLIAIVLAVLFTRYRNLHAIAIGHGLFNFVVLCFSIL